jgi:hypothetical protein
MKITVSQLRRIIREEVEKVTGGSLPFGGVYNDETGEMLDMGSVPPQYLHYVDKNKSEEVEGKKYQAFIQDDDDKETQGDKFEELRGELKGLSAGKPKKQRLAPFQLNKKSNVSDDYIRDVDRDMPTSWDSPDPQDVHDEFLMWRDKNGEVPLEKLASELGVDPNRIDWNGTGLRVMGGVVTELIGDTPYREKMGEVRKIRWLGTSGSRKI